MRMSMKEKVKAFIRVEVIDFFFDFFFFLGGGFRK